MARKKRHTGRLSGLKKKDFERFVKNDTTDEEIGRKYGVTRQAVAQMRWKLGVNARTERNKKRNDKIIAMYNRGLSGAKIAEKIGLSISQTYRILSEA